MNLNNTDNRKIDSAYIITIPNNENSLSLSKRCIISCISSSTPYSIWEAFDGTGPIIKTPKHLENQWFTSWLKVYNNRLSNSQLACFLSHFSLWAHCATIDKPIIILEHDAIMVKPLEYHKYYNAIQFLGCKEQVEGSKIVNTIPPWGSIYETNWRFICRAHAYAIDPPVARSMISYVLKEGITKTLDVILRPELFMIIQDDLYAYDEPGISTINEKEDYKKDW